MVISTIGVMRGLQECASSRGTMTILAVDHRQNLRRLLGNDPASVPDGALIEFKRQVVRGLSSEATGVLLDPEFGVCQCIEDGSLPGDVGLIVALEATGYDGLPSARVSRILDGWSVQEARRIGASAVKLLLYHHPEALTADAQERLLEQVVTDSAQSGLALFVEGLTHPITHGAPLVGVERRRVVVASARRLSAIGGDVLKVEFPGDPRVEDPVEWSDACAELDEAIGRPWVLLSAGASPDVFLRQAEAACRAGASGVAAGRAVWGGAVAVAPIDRGPYLATIARARLTELAAMVESVARPWQTARSRAGS